MEMNFFNSEAEMGALEEEWEDVEGGDERNDVRGRLWRFLSGYIALNGVGIQAMLQRVGALFLRMERR